MESRQRKPMKSRPTITLDKEDFDDLVANQKTPQQSRELIQAMIRKLSAMPQSNAFPIPDLISFLKNRLHDWEQGRE
jgi:hypothetical protein